MRCVLYCLSTGLYTRRSEKEATDGIRYTDKILSKFASAYKKSYSSDHVLLKLIEEWKKSLKYYWSCTYGLV